MMKFTVLLLASLSFTPCKKSEPAKSEPAPSGAPAPSALPAEPAAAPAAPAPASGDVDLSPGGAAWKGWAIKGPANAQVTDNGAGGVSVLFGTFGFEMSQGDLNLKDRKSGIAFGAETSKGKVAYNVDKPDALEWTTETPMGDGTTKGYGFAYFVNAEKKIGCSGQLDDEQQVAAAKAACNSLHQQ